MRVMAATVYDLGWIVAMTGCHATAEFRAIKAIDRHGMIQGMIGYDLWTPNTVWMHIALRTPYVLKSLIRPAFEYPFIQSKLGAVLCGVISTNKKSTNLVRGVGFREVYRIKDGWVKGDDMVIYEMRRDECRWIKGA